MSAQAPSPGAPGLIDRVKNILLQPRAEWDRIAIEPFNLARVYLGYLLPLAAVAGIAATIGLIFFRVGGFGFSIHIPAQTAIVSGALEFVLTFVRVYVLALIINALAPNFGSQANGDQAQKLSVYSATASLVAGVVMVLPSLGVLVLLASIYSLVLLYLGLPRLMKTPDDKRFGYFATIIVVAIVLFFVAGLIVTTVRNTFGGWGSVQLGSSSSTSSSRDDTVTLPGGGAINRSDLENLGQAVQGGSAGAPSVVIDPTRLQALMPDNLPGGFTRTSLSSSGTGAIGAAEADGIYENGDARIKLTIVHMGSMAGLSSMAGSLNVQQNREDANGYAHTRTIDGRVYSEQLDRAAGSAQYVIVGHGVSITAEGTGSASVDQTRGAAEMIDIQRLEGLGGAPATATTP